MVRTCRIRLPAEVAAAEIPHANLDAPDIAHRVQTKVRPSVSLLRSSILAVSMTRAKIRSLLA